MFYLVTVSSLFLTIIVASGFLGSDPGWISSMVKSIGWKNCPKNRSQNYNFRHIPRIRTETNQTEAPQFLHSHAVFHVPSRYWMDKQIPSFCKVEHMPTVLFTFYKPEFYVYHLDVSSNFWVHSKNSLSQISFKIHSLHVVSIQWYLFHTLQVFSFSLNQIMCWSLKFLGVIMLRTRLTSKVFSHSCQD